ncbi:MAG: multiheme c-type cytochrome [Gammaproteobacteria bacterium]
MLQGRRKIAVVAGLAVVAVLALLLIQSESFSSLYDAQYVGASVCGDCHTQIFPQWERSPHANMTRDASVASVVGNFDNLDWFAEGQRDRPVAKMYRNDDAYVMALRHPHSDEYVPFEIERVVGYQYRQVYLTREEGGVLRRLPLQWSTELQDFFSYWNFQEGRKTNAADLWDQMKPLNSAWNLFCARCHTTKLAVDHKNAQHTVADTHWVDEGIACEACHGPGSAHVNYMSGNPANRIAAWVNSKVRKQPVAYIANAAKLDKGAAMSVCARCHGADIFRKTMDTYRLYEPGYSPSGRINDLSAHFRETPLTPRSGPPTMETWADSRPKGIGTLFRSFVESTCYQEAQPRCFQCHNPHDNKMPAKPGMLEPSAQSDAYCLDCHAPIAQELVVHTQHDAGSEGSHCYDCHMPKHIMVAATGVLRYSRTHLMSYVPDPKATIRFGQDNAPNACNDCHQDKTPQWALSQIEARKR